MLQTVSRAAFRRPAAALGGWALLVAVAIALAVALGSSGGDDELPGSDSRAAYALLGERFPERRGDDAQLVIRAEAGVDDPAVRAAVEDVAGRVAEAPGVREVVLPWAPGAEAQVSPDRRTAFALVVVDPEIDAAGAGRIRDLVAADAPGGVVMELGGAVFVDEGSGPPSELIGLAAAGIVILLAFMSVRAALLPILVGVAGIALGLALVGIASAVLVMPEFAAAFAAMIGLGVGIDYALLVVTRFRAERGRGLAPERALAVAYGTAGRSALFAGATVVVSMLGMALLGLEFLTGLAVGAAAAVVATVLATVTLLPALLRLMGGRPDARATVRGDGGAASRRLAGVIARRPGLALGASLAIVAVLAAPVAGIDLGLADGGTRPTSDTTRRAYDLVAEGFGPGANGPLVLAVDLAGAADGPAAARDVRDRVAAVPGVASVGEPVLGPRGDAAAITAVPATGPADDATEDLVRRLRDDLAGHAARTGVTTHVGGVTASGIDFGDAITGRVPLLVAAVLGVSGLLLLVVFRSVYVPLVATAVNLLSFAAAFGVVTAVFQWGWGASLLGVDATGPVEPWAPPIMFGVVFGLSMDYTVFLLSRVHESVTRHGDAHAAVTDGVAASMRVIGAAALVMICVFASFAVSPTREIQLVGVGLASAVILDATVIRLVMLPALLHLRGARAWALPAPLERVVPRVSVETPAEG